MAKVEEPFVEKVKAEQVPPRKARQVVKTKAIRAKRSPLAGIFFSADGTGLLDTVVQDILIPGANALAYNALNGLLAGIFGQTPANGGSGYREYNRIYTQGRDDPPWRSTSKSRPRNKRIFSDIGLETKQEGEEVLREMQRFIYEYSAVTVSDFLTFVGESSDYTDAEWGWTELTGAHMERTPRGWIFKLPPAKPLKF